jgi:hypothetical protein
VLRFVVAVGLTVVAMSCSTPVDTTEPNSQIAAGTVVITLDKSSYTWEEASTDGVRGTLRNTSDATIYSRLGDAFNGAIEQDPLFISHGSDGSVERSAGTNQWLKADMAILIEGTRFIVLRPGQSYQFIAPLSGAARQGTYRIAVTHRSTINDEERAAVNTSYSAIFEIR